MNTRHEYAATCPKGVERLLGDELRSLGASDVVERHAVVTFTGALEIGYRACLWSRVASRVLLKLAEFPASDAEALYQGVASIEWERHVAPAGTIAVDAVGRSAGLTHSHFTALRTKDAIVDRIRERTGERPSVDTASPDVRVNVRLHRERATVSVDLSGAPLHERGYRTPGEQAEAPLKENLAAAVLLRAGWPDIAAAGGALVDPMCGSGTLLIEGALIASDQAPGLLRERWGFAGWLGHDDALWHALLDDADARAEAGRARLPVIAGSDSDAAAIALASACAKRAGLGGAVALEVAEVSALAPPAGVGSGLLITNPPYGVRLGGDLEPLYASLGERLLAGFDGWRAGVLTTEDSLARATGLRSSAAYTLYNGAIETKLYVFEISAGSVKREVRSAPVRRSEGATMFANRLHKNAKHLAKWARREGVSCYRVYDADLPEYAVAVDLYEGAGPDAGRRFAHVAEYAPPAEIDPAKAEARLAEAVDAVAEVLGVEPADVAVKVRRRQRGTSQYERVAERGEAVTIAEGGLRFEVNLHDYLDTGIFLDHRPVRAMLRDLAPRARFLNLFGYTGTATVYAVAGGASSATTVDLSNTYIDWAKRNLALNGFAEGPAVRFFRADVVKWLAEERRRVETGSVQPYDLVFCDPPTFSSSKGMGERTFEVGRDHAALIRDAAALLGPRGTLLFSTNYRRFEMDPGLFSELEIDDITAETIPPDFARTPRIHRCFRIAGTSPAAWE